MLRASSWKLLTAAAWPMAQGKFASQTRRGRAKQMVRNAVLWTEAGSPFIQLPFLTGSASDDKTAPVLDLIAAGMPKRGAAGMTQRYREEHEMPDGAPYF